MVDATIVWIPNNNEMKITYGAKAAFYLLMVVLAINIPVYFVLSMGNAVHSECAITFFLSNFLVIGMWLMFVLNKLEFTRQNLILISVPIILSVLLFLRMIPLIGIGT